MFLRLGRPVLNCSEMNEKRWGSASETTFVHSFPRAFPHDLSQQALQTYISSSWLIALGFSFSSLLKIREVRRKCFHLRFAYTSVLLGKKIPILFNLSSFLETQNNVVYSIEKNLSLHVSVLKKSG